MFCFKNQRKIRLYIYVYECVYTYAYIKNVLNLNPLRSYGDTCIYIEHVTEKRYIYLLLKFIITYILKCFYIHICGCIDSVKIYLISIKHYT